MSIRARRRGFTLIELLVVVIIIAMIAGMLLTAINAARHKARVARVALEVSQLGEALEAYRDKNGGEYPPDFTDLQLSGTQYAQYTRAHLARAFPRHNRPAINTWLATTPATQQPSNLDPAEALVFWLGLVMNDVVNPVCAPNGSNVPLSVGGGRPPFHDFDRGRLRDRDGDGWPEYYPLGVDNAPFVYFSFHTYSIASYPYPAPAAGVLSPIGVARPYQGAPNVWVEPTKYQIVTSGLDNDYGADTVVNPPNAFKQIPSQLAIEGVNLTLADRDNIVSFSGEGRTIEGMRP